MRTLPIILIKNTMQSFNSPHLCMTNNKLILVMYEVQLTIIYHLWLMDRFTEYQK